jgi:hypothetical protein
LISFLLSRLYRVDREGKVRILAHHACIAAITNTRTAYDTEKCQVREEKNKKRREKQNRSRKKRETEKREFTARATAVHRTLVGAFL